MHIPDMDMKLSMPNLTCFGRTGSEPDTWGARQNPQACLMRRREAGPNYSITCASRDTPKRRKWNSISCPALRANLV